MSTVTKNGKSDGVIPLLLHVEVPPFVDRRSSGPPPRRRIWRRYTNIVINLTLLALILMSFSTGWIASLLGLTEFGLHKYSSIALALVAAGHLALHWRSLAAQLRNIGTSRYDRRNPAQYDRRAPRPAAGIAPVPGRTGTE